MKENKNKELLQEDITLSEVSPTLLCKYIPSLQFTTTSEGEYLYLYNGDTYKAKSLISLNKFYSSLYLIRSSKEKSSKNPYTLHIKLNKRTLLPISFLETTITINSKERLSLYNKLYYKLRTINNRKKEREENPKYYTCKVCGKVFIKAPHKKSSHLFCSSSCKEAYYARIKREKEKIYTFTCKTCGKKFTTHKPWQKFCSKSCRSKLYNSIYKSSKVKAIPLTKTCPICKGLFTTTKSSKKYCSKTCYLESKKYIKKEKIIHNKICKTCGGKFTTTNKLVKYCSLECRRIQQNSINLKYYYKKKLNKTS